MLLFETSGTELAQSNDAIASKHSNKPCCFKEPVAQADRVPMESGSNVSSNLTAVVNKAAWPSGEAPVDWEVLGSNPSWFTCQSPRECPFKSGCLLNWGHKLIGRPCVAWRNVRVVDGSCLLNSWIKSPAGSNPASSVVCNIFVEGCTISELRKLV